MNRFVKLKIHDALRDEYVERWFNVDAIRHIEPDTNKVLLVGAKSPVVASTESMENLLQEIKNDIALKKVPFMIERRLYDLNISDVAAMQQDLDAYDMSFANIVGYLRGNFTKEGATMKPAVLSNIAARDEVNMRLDAIFESAFELRRKYDELKEQFEALTNDASCVPVDGIGTIREKHQKKGIFHRIIGLFKCK